MYCTAAGGDIMFGGGRGMSGTGDLVPTGQLGDVMKESARAALTYAKSHAGQLAIPSQAFVDTDVHVHVPAGAAPEGGPPAGGPQPPAPRPAPSQRGGGPRPPARGLRPPPR